MTNLLYFLHIQGLNLCFSSFKNQFVIASCFPNRLVIFFKNLVYELIFLIFLILVLKYTFNFLIKSWKKKIVHEKKIVGVLHLYITCDNSSWKKIGYIFWYIWSKCYTSIRLYSWWWFKRINWYYLYHQYAFTFR